MSFLASLPPSPVAAAFASIQWEPLEKLRLTAPEKTLLRSAEDNPLDYTLADRNEAAAYARVLLKVLAEASGPSGPSSKVSRLQKPLPDNEVLPILTTDPMGVVTHYSITKLYEVVMCLREKTAKSGVSIATTFYTKNGILIEDWRPLLRVLHLGGPGDAFAQRGAALILTYVLMTGCASQKANNTFMIKSSIVEEPLRALVSWISSQLQSSASTSLTLVTPSLTVLMSCPEARTIFRDSGGIGYLSRHMRQRQNRPPRKSRETGVTVQQLYELCFCLWTLTYECNNSPTVRSHFARDGAVPALVDLVATAPREKVVRVALSALRNLATCTANVSPDAAGKKPIDGAVFLTEMIGCGLIKSIDLMKERPCTDPDIVEDLDLLYKLLHENYKEMSRWDVYQAEVESGHLEWGVVHTEKFFKEHAKRIEGTNGDFAILRMLIKLLASDDEDVAAIACFDIGEFARHYPNGRAITKRLGAKDLIMQMIEHENAIVQRHALQCVSKMLVQNWAAVR